MIPYNNHFSLKGGNGMAILDSKERSIVGIYTDLVKVRYLKSQEMRGNLRRFISKVYTTRRDSYPLFIFNEDAMKFTFLYCECLNDEQILVKKYFSKCNYTCYVIESVRQYPRGFKLQEKEVFFFKKEEDGDYSLRGFLSNRPTSKNFFPSELSEFEEELLRTVGIVSYLTEFDTDIIFSVPTYVE